jgi:hypothetical protein
MLITCPDCARQVSDAAPACPGCGRPLANATAKGAAGEEERTILDDPAVKVTTKRVTFAGGAMLPTAQITTVQPFVDRGFNFGIVVSPVFIVGAIVCAAHAVSRVEFSTSESMPWAVGAVAAVLGTLACIPVGSRLRSTRHWVAVTSGGTTTRGVFSRDPAWTDRVVKAIGEAISAK